MNLELRKMHVFPKVLIALVMLRNSADLIALCIERWSCSLSQTPS